MTPRMRAVARQRARADERSGTRELENQDLVHLSVPARVCVLAQIAAAQQPGLIVVGAEIGGARMGNVDRDQRDARFEILRRNGRRDRFVGLKFDDEVDLFLDQVLRVSKRHLGLIPVVDDDELEPLAFSGAKQPGVHLTGKRAVLPLGRIPDAKPPPRPDHGHKAVVSLVDFFYEPAVMQRVEQPEAHPFPVTGPLDDVAQAEHFTRRLKRLQNRGGVHQRLHEIAVVSSVGHER